MIDPKAFYRALDSLLARIRLQGDDRSFLPDILTAFQEAFGPTLHFGIGRLYDERDGSFDLVAGAPGQERLGRDHPAIAAVLEHGSYVFERPDERDWFDGGGDGVPAAFSVWQTTTRRWIFVYELGEGWSHEEVAFAMNAVRFALNNRLQAEAVRSDVEQAAEIQRSLLPSDVPRFEGFEFAAKSIPAESVGGDFFDFIDLGSDVVGVSIGDASGHGLPAALLVRDVMTGLRMGMEAQLKMLHTMKKLNRVVHRSAWSSRFLSVFYGEIEKNGNILYANAGHTSPVLVSASAVHRLEPTGTVFGPLPEIHLERNFVRMEPGSVLVLMTDGIIERFDELGDMFGLEGVEELVRANLSLTAPELIDLVFAEVRTFGGAAPLADDATLVVIRRLAP
jgi:sigma-B regulation protein RsbU (phosphoserine phosphatase)